MIKLKGKEVKLLFVLGLNCHCLRRGRFRWISFEFGGGEGSEAMDFLGSRRRGSRGSVKRKLFLSWKKTRKNRG